MYYWRKNKKTMNDEPQKPELTEIEKAQLVIKKDAEARAEKFKVGYEALCKETGCQLQSGEMVIRIL